MKQITSRIRRLFQISQNPRFGYISHSTLADPSIHRHAQTPQPAAVLGYFLG
jgi:hypothetical protein